ncbi:ubiquitin-like small modifier protein 1 [Halobacteriaceae archaeon GCM10025711]
MGFRNHLHVCQHCGVVHATSSSTGPRVCAVCKGFDFSEYSPEKYATWKLFGEFKRAVGKKEVRVRLADGATVGDALDGLLDRYSALAQLVGDPVERRSDVHLLLNHVDVGFADGLDSKLKADDELALFTPVA